MSETNEQDMGGEEQAPPALPIVPGLKVTTRQTQRNLKPVEIITATWGEPLRTVEMRQLSLGEEFDLSEIAGLRAGNSLWLNMAVAAASVTAIDSVPPSPWAGIDPRQGNDALRRTLDKLDRDGLRVVTLVLNGYRGPDAPLPTPATVEAHRDAVGNS